MSTVTFKYRCGDKVKDRVTGFKGIIESRTEHLNGCLRYTVTAPARKDGEVKAYMIDEAQLELVDAGLNKVNPVKKTKTGGPRQEVKYGT